jgi:hypothetical protein
MKIFSCSTTGLSPVLKKPHPIMKGQEKTKAGVALDFTRIQEKLQTTTTNNNNYKQQLITRIYSSAFSSVGPPLSPFQKGIKRERHPDQESSTANATAFIDMGSVIGNRRLTTSTINNAPDQHGRVVDQAKTCTTNTVTGSLLQKPVTVAASNQGSCDRNTGKAVTTDKMGAIIVKNGGNKK